MIVGLSGYAQSGKDTFGRILVDEHGFERISFADKLRDMLYALNPVVRFRNQDAIVSVQDVVGSRGWEWAKENTEVRELLQRLGTEAGRKVLGENVWVDAALSKVRLGSTKNYVITDVRFLNEAEAIRDRGGIVLRVNRPGTKPINPHPSETELDGYAFAGYVRNDKGMENLRVIARTIALFAGPDAL